VQRRRHQKRDGHAGTGKDKSTSVAILGAIQREIQRRNVITGDPGLIEMIRAEISAQGPMSFARFMELALYEPEHGYYSSGRAIIGRQGDFFTNVSVGSVFGQLLGMQFAEVWEKLGRPPHFTIVEHGAHDGAFATDALTALRQSFPECFNTIRYIIAEPFPVWHDRQQKGLASFGDKIRRVESINQVEPFVGVHFSNELFDALPVHLVLSEAVKNGAVAWNQRFVSMSGNDFELVSGPVSDPHLEIALHRLPLLPSSVQTELNLAALKLMRQIAAKLARGVILTIDYGFSRAEFYSPHRREGSLQIRSGHRKLPSPFQQIGHADISAHVEWTSLAEAGEEAGVLPLGFTDQHHFFTGIISKYQTAEKEFGTTNKRALQTLLHPELLGRNFQVLGLAKNFPESLSGFRYARNVRGELGL
jgi:SAM-dependent MidA family methyltransferase